MEAMDRTGPARTMITIPKGIGHERANAGLRSMGVGDPQFCDFYHIRFQLLQAADVKRLALVRGIQRYQKSAERPERAPISRRLRLEEAESEHDKNRRIEDHQPP